VHHIALSATPTSPWPIGSLVVLLNVVGSSHPARTLDQSLAWVDTSHTHICDKMG
jgi:hypothetical protein